MKKQYLTFEQKQKRIQECFEKALIKIKEANNLISEESSEDIDKFRNNDLFEFIQNIITECGVQNYYDVTKYWDSSDCGF